MSRYLQKDMKFYLRKLKTNVSTYRVLNHRSDKTFYIENRPIHFSNFHKKAAYIALSNKKRALALSVFRKVAKSWNDYIIKNDFKVKRIKPIHKSSDRDLELFGSFPDGTEFWYIDINNCYWEFNHKLGYISDNLYHAYLNDADLKLFRNMSMSMQTSERLMEYYVDHIKVFEIKESRNLHNAMYENIRTSSFNLVGDAFGIAQSYNDGFAYRTDGILMRNPEAIAKVVQFFNENGLDVKGTLVFKAGTSTILDSQSNQLKKI